ncbi:MAG: leucine-rich repeat protein [Muribaculum sp.]|nr:leucine-rich repeat protein [Muribaculum sp.]
MFCPNCGGEIPENAKFCSKCGMKAKTKGKSAEKKIRLGYIAGAAAVVLVFAVVVWAAVEVVIWGEKPIEDGILPIGTDTEDCIVKSDTLEFHCHSDDTACVYIHGDVDIEELVIPSEVKARWRKYSITKTYSVTEIGIDAFIDCSSLTSIELPASVTEIGDSAFSGCCSLTSIELPIGVTEIGDSAFSGCDSLTNIELPASVTEIGDSAFSSCDSLTSIELPASVTEIRDYTFGDCNSLTSIEIPDSVTEIGDTAFIRCISLVNIELPASVTEIGDSAFSGCRSLTSIELPASVTEIGDNAFYDCDSLTSIEIPASVTEIGDGAFSKCRNLVSIKYGGREATTVGRIKGGHISSSRKDFVSGSAWINYLLFDDVTGKIEK